MGTLVHSELAPHAERLLSAAADLRDANVPAGLVAHMRARLSGTCCSCLEEKTLRRAPTKHYRLAQQLRRTLVTSIATIWTTALSARGGGVLVIHAPTSGNSSCCWSESTARCSGALRSPGRPGTRDDPATADPIPLPLAGRKLQVNSDWGREDA